MNFQITETFWIVDDSINTFSHPKLRPSLMFVFTCAILQVTVVCKKIILEVTVSTDHLYQSQILKPVVTVWYSTKNVNCRMYLGVYLSYFLDVFRILSILALFTDCIKFRKVC